MNRLTTDKPHGNFETAMNFAYAKNGEVWLRGADDGKDAELCAYIAKRAFYLELCGITNKDDVIEACGAADCFCELGALFAAATQAAELRARLTAYEDTGLEPEEAEAAKKIVARLALADYPHNFQRERSDIVSYMNWITSVMEEAKAWWKKLLEAREDAEKALAGRK